MRALLTARVLHEELEVLKQAAKKERDDESVSRWLVELGLARAAEIGIRGAKKLLEEAPE